MLMKWFAGAVGADQAHPEPFDGGVDVARRGDRAEVLVQLPCASRIAAI